MGAALGDQHPVAGFQRRELRRAAHKPLEIALVAGKENGKRRERDILRHVLRHRAERLRVGDDHARAHPQRSKRVRQLLRLAGDEAGVGVQQVAHGLLLRQDQPPLGRGAVDGRDQHRHIPGGYHVGNNTAGIFQLLGVSAQHFFQRVDVLAGQGADVQLVVIARGALFEQVRLVVGDDVGHLAGAELRDQVAILRREAAGGVRHQHGDVCAQQGLVRLFHALFPQLPRVVEARGVDDDRGAEGLQFHRLFDGVGGGALHVADHGEVLPRDGVDQTGLAGVAHAEKADVYTLGGGGIVESHGGASFIRIGNRGGWSCGCR